MTQEWGNRYIIFVRKSQLAGVGETLKNQGATITGLMPFIGAIACRLQESGIRIVQTTMESVVWVEPDYRVQIIRDNWVKARRPELVPWGVRRIGAPKAWPKTTGRGVRVGVLDTGIDLRHPDLVSNIAEGINLLKPKEPEEDDYGHGTHISGIIAAASNRFGVTGVAPEAHIVPIKAFDNQGESRLSTIAAGIEWAISNGVKLLNMSFGTSRPSRTMHMAINEASRAGIALIAAAGNDPERSGVDYPAIYPGVLGVGATNRADQVADFSSGGRGLDLVAPGVDITSTWPPGAYHDLSGTSMAAAHTSGAAALLLAQEPGLSPGELYDLIWEEATTPLEGIAASRQGRGLLDITRLF